MIASAKPAAGDPPLTDDDVNPSSGPGAFGPFRVLHQIGVGVLGPVFRAYDPSDDRAFIVKELRLDVTPEQAQALVEALERAAGAGAFHPAVVMPVAVGIEEGTPFLVQEHIAAPPLDATTRRAATAEPQWTLALLDALADALDAAHGRGLLHGALHPRDIFVTDGLPRVTGFGVVPALEQAGLRGPVRRPYAAPEMVAGGSWGPEADRYALAAVACELLTGRRPAGAGAQAAGDIAAVEEAADAGALRALFGAALAATPARRPVSAGRFAALLRQALGVPAEAPGENPGAGAARPPEERQAVAAPDAAAAAGGAAEPISIREEERRDGEPELASPRRSVPPAPGAGAFEDAGPDAPEADADPADRLPPAAASWPQRAEWPWWSPVAMAAAAGLVIVAVAAAYVAGLRLGGNMAAPDAVSEAAPAPAFAQEFPEADPFPVAAAPAAVPQSRSAPPPPPAEMPAAPAAIDAPEPPPATGLAGAPAGPAGAPAAPAPAAAGGSGWVLVRSTPPGAGVALDGAERGLTPLTVGDVPFGSRTVEVRRAGFQPATREVAVSPSSPVAAVEVTLAPLPAVDGAPPAAALGSLVVESRPPGARVIVAGRSAGATPTIVSGLAAGPHEVRIELEGYLPWVTSVDVQAAGELRVAASLEGAGGR